MQTGSGGRASAYRSVSAWSSVADQDPQRLVVVLYDCALERIAAARGCMENGCTGDKNELVHKALAIVAELRGSLDRVRGGEIAAHLDDLYDYMGRRLVQANAANQPEALEEVASLLRELRQGWAGIADPATRPA
jgi:flagellar protein FliS